MDCSRSSERRRLTGNALKSMNDPSNTAIVNLPHHGTHMRSSHRNATTTVTTILGLLLAGTVHATNVSMAGGAITFKTPDTWQGIMQTEGDPEARVFQVPDPSPTGKSSLARVTVTVKKAPDIAAFDQYKDAAAEKAKLLPAYRPSSGTGDPNEIIYSARENGAEFNYVEHYWFKNGRAIQLRCVRPAQSEAGTKWTTEFDKGCGAIADQLK